MFNFQSIIPILCLLSIRTNAYCQTVSDWSKGLPGNVCDQSKNLYWCPTSKECVLFTNYPDCPQCNIKGFTQFCREDGTTNDSCCEKYDECNPTPEPDCYTTEKWHNGEQSSHFEALKYCGDEKYLGSTGAWYCPSKNECLFPGDNYVPANCPDCNDGYLYDGPKKQCCKSNVNSAAYAASAVHVMAEIDNVDGCKLNGELCDYGYPEACCSDHCIFEKCNDCKEYDVPCTDHEECCSLNCKDNDHCA